MNTEKQKITHKKYLLVGIAASIPALFIFAVMVHTLRSTDVDLLLIWSIASTLMMLSAFIIGLLLNRS